MTMPDHDGMTAVASQVSQVLIKQGEMAVQLAVIAEQLKALPDQENRIRTLEAGAAQQTGGRDMWARIVSLVAVLAALGAALGVYLHH